MSEDHGDPATKFATAQAVVADRNLNKEQKQRILENWRQDAELLQQADAENMRGGKRPRLREVNLALAELDKLPPRDDP